MRTLASRVVSLPQPNDPHAIDGYDLSHRIGVRDCEDRSEIKTALAPVFALLVV